MNLHHGLYFKLIGLSIITFCSGPVLDKLIFSEAIFEQFLLQENSRICTAQQNETKLLNIFTEHLNLSRRKNFVD